MTFKAQLLCLAYMSVFGTEHTNYHQACEHAQTIVEVSSTYGVEPEIIMSLIKQESNFQQELGPNKVGACGLGQQIPAYTSKYSNKKYTCSEIKRNPNVSITLVAQAIIWLQDNYTLKENTKLYSEKNIKWTLCMYSSGPKQCPEKSWKATKHGTGYARSILRNAAKLKVVQEEIEAYLTYP